MSKWWKFWESEPEELPENWRELQDHIKFDWIIKLGCLVCLENPKFEVYEGPSGGMSQNVWCSKCGTRWNMAQFPPQLGFKQQTGLAELVHEREREDEVNERRSDSESEDSG